MNFKSLGLSFLLVVFSGFAVSAYSHNKVQPRIIGGETVDQEYSWMVSVQDSAFEDSFCGGTLIDQYWVLTAAHCLEGLSANDVGVLIGSIHKSRYQYGKDLIHQVFIHPEYDPTTLDNDIALLKLAEPSEKQVATLADLDQVNSLSEGTDLMVMGWGTTDPDYPIYPFELQSVEVKLQSNASCQAIYDNIDGDVICAGLDVDGFDSCSGDSGGPILARIDNELVHIGIVSYGDGCAKAGRYGVYTKTSRYLEWIEAVTTGVWGPANIDFGYLGLGMQDTLEFMVVNTTNEDISFIASVVGADSDGFSYAGGSCQNQILANSSCSVIVQTQPTNSAEYSTAWLQLQKVGEPTNIQYIPLKVTGLPLINVTDVLNINDAKWYSGGDTAWGKDSQIIPSEVALSSGDIIFNQESVLLVDVSNISRLSLAIKVESEMIFDGLAILVDGENVDFFHGDVDWFEWNYTVPKGAKKLEFIYLKDGSLSVGADSAWIASADILESQEDSNDRESSGSSSGSSKGGGGGSLRAFAVLLLVSLVGLRRVACRQNSFS